MAQMPDDDDTADEAGFVPLTAQQARQIVANNPSLSPWKVVGWQVLAGLAVTVLSGLVTGSLTVALSALCGALAVVLPAALFAWGVGSQFAKANVGAAVMNFFWWEFVKILGTLAVMYAAWRLVNNLNGLAMLAGLVVTIKVYWFALGFRPKVQAVRTTTPNGTSNDTSN